MSPDPKPVMAAFIHSLQERIVGKEIAQFQNGFAQLLQGESLQTKIISAVSIVKIRPSNVFIANRTW